MVEAVDGPAVDDAAAVEEVRPVATVEGVRQGAPVGSSPVPASGPVPIAVWAAGLAQGGGADLELLELVVEGVLEGAGQLSGFGLADPPHGSGHLVGRVGVQDEGVEGVDRHGDGGPSGGVAPFGSPVGVEPYSPAGGLFDPVVAPAQADQVRGVGGPGGPGPDMDAPMQRQVLLAGRRGLRGWLGTAPG